MSVMSWVVYGLNIDYCNELKKNENESLWDLGSYGAWLCHLWWSWNDFWKSLNMLKSLCKHSTVQMMMMDEFVIVSSVVCLLLFWCKSTLFSSKWSWKKSKWSMEVIIHCVCLRWFWKKPILFVYTIVLRWANFDAKFTVLVSNGLERSHLWVLIFSWALTLACHCIL